MVKSEWTVARSFDQCTHEITKSRSISLSIEMKSFTVWVNLLFIMCALRWVHLAFKCWWTSCVFFNFSTARGWYWYHEYTQLLCVYFLCFTHQLILLSGHGIFYWWDQLFWRNTHCLRPASLLIGSSFHTNF